MLEESFAGVGTHQLTGMSQRWQFCERPRGLAFLEEGTASAEVLGQESFHSGWSIVEGG